ncbi:MAG: hypothetical protein ACK5QX_01505 [bacterium]|jgi:hypothetical protein
MERRRLGASAAGYCRRAALAGNVQCACAAPHGSPELAQLRVGFLCNADPCATLLRLTAMLQTKMLTSSCRNSLHSRRLRPAVRL